MLALCNIPKIEEEGIPFDHSMMTALPWQQNKKNIYEKKNNNNN